MKTIDDHAKDIRQRLIDGRPRTEAERKYQEYIAAGFSEHAAANLSGFHPIMPVEDFVIAALEWATSDRALNVLGWALVIGCSLIAILAVGNAQARAGGSKGSEANEAAMIDCMNGEPIRFSDGTRWACIKLMEVRK